jgi:hypothetical protein
VPLAEVPIPDVAGRRVLTSRKPADEPNTAAARRLFFNKIDAKTHTHQAPNFATTGVEVTFEEPSRKTGGHRRISIDAEPRSGQYGSLM